MSCHDRLDYRDAADLCACGFLACYVPFPKTACQELLLAWPSSFVGGGGGDGETRRYEGFTAHMWGESGSIVELR